MVTVRLYPGDRVRYLDEPSAFGTLLSVPYDGEASVRLDDGRAIRVPVERISRITENIPSNPAD
ncbi:hypothetical protein FK268_13530 [Tsukamurella sputi]|uniref:Uncharacterized protein n=1 Tax=Tsukamurella sputi TaxID=2591848 RepID=A0A5C5RK33_9ACTN|nr:hypothetical protein [Tsukamurella sputi]TWS23317.1 hypothetical protein FK268_13530 [Tsukamurella sputi]